MAKALGELLKARPANEPKSRAGSERAVLLERFVTEINKERYGTKWKPMTGRGVALKTSHLSLKDLYHFLGQCVDYRRRKGSFSRAFFGALKPKKQ